jgi:predicted site-specific integrase-resolvase
MQLIRVRDAAKRYSLSPFTIYHWSCDGKFPTLFARLGKILYVDETELKKLVRQSKVKEAANG